MSIHFESEHVPSRRAAPSGAVLPDLSFTIEEGGVLAHAAAPTLRFALRVACGDGTPIRSTMLAIQLRIAASQRTYDALTKARLAELFGEPHQWASTSQSLFWTDATVIVPAFTGATTADLRVVCSTDLDLAVTKYFDALGDGEIPLDFLFSGSMLYTDAEGQLRTGRIPLHKDARYRLPVAVWKEMMAHYFPNSVVLRVQRDTYERLHAFKRRQALPTWDGALEHLLVRAGVATS